MREANRRTFMTDCSAGAAGLAVLSGVKAAAGDAEPEGEGTPFLCMTCGTQSRQRGHSDQGKGCCPALGRSVSAGDRGVERGGGFAKPARMMINHDPRFDNLVRRTVRCLPTELG
jgi:hypothetical protein